MKRTPVESPDLAALAKDIIADCEKLIGDHVALLRSEVCEELGQAKSAALHFGAGAGLVATGGLLSTLMAVHFLHRNTRLPLWSCYGLVAGAAGVAGIRLLQTAQAEAQRLHLPALPQTQETLKEDIAWLRERACE